MFADKISIIHIKVFSSQAMFHWFLALHITSNKKANLISFRLIFNKSLNSTLKLYPHNNHESDKSKQLPKQAESSH